MKITFLSTAKTLLLSLSVVLTACDGSDTDPQTNAVANPVVDVQSSDCPAAKSDRLIANDTCEPIPAQIALNTTVTGSVTPGQQNIYKIPSDTQVVLTTDSGDADLYLYPDSRLDENSRLCRANKPFKEDVCATGTSDTDLFAVVRAKEASQYNLIASNDCSVEAINQWVYRNMKDYYLYADQVPVVNPDTYDTPGALIRDLRFEELDPFSNIKNTVSQETMFDEGISYGFGYNWRYDANRNARVIFTYKNSAMGLAGIKRGDIIVSIEGELWSDMTNERYRELVGNPDNPRTTNWTFIDGDTQSTKSVSLTYSEYNIDTVLYSSVYQHEEFSGKVGYIVFNDFLATSEAELDQAINKIINLGASDLILDMRYNPGGYTYIARRLASQLAGASLNGNTLVKYEYNDTYAQQNFQRHFVAATPTLSLETVVVLTTGSTASSAELVINALRPYLEVVTIGSATRGKPFISSSRKFCGLSLNAMEAQGVNASGVSVAGGIPADCYASDDPTRPFGINANETEGMLDAALDYFIYGTCDVGPALAKRSQPANATGAFREPAATSTPADNFY